MTEDNKRTEAARGNDDSELIEEMEGAPGFAGGSGGNLQRDIGVRAEAEHEAGDETGVTRVRAGDKGEEADLPRFNER